MKNTDDVLDEVLGVLDPVEKELGIKDNHIINNFIRKLNDA